MERTAARKIAHELMIAHGLRGWHFRFDRAVNRFGSCRYSKREITLSGPLTDRNDETQVRDTILHEIAHALTPGAGHGPAWRKVCREIGAVPKATVSAQEVETVPGRYYLVCPHCDNRIPRQRKPRQRLVCRSCWNRHQQGLAERPAPLNLVPA